MYIFNFLGALALGMSIPQYNLLLLTSLQPPLSSPRMLLTVPVAASAMLSMSPNLLRPAALEISISKLVAPQACPGLASDKESRCQERISS